MIDVKAIAEAHLEQARDPDTQIFAVSPERQIWGLVDRGRRPRQRGARPKTIEIAVDTEAEAEALRAEFDRLLGED